MRDNDTSGFIGGSGNVFADLDVPNADERQQKSRLAMGISDAINAQGISHAVAVKRTGLTLRGMTDILHGRLRGYSVERLTRVLHALVGSPGST